MTEKTFYEDEYTAEQKVLADEIISLEKAALDKWFSAADSGCREIWSEKSFTYFDSVMDHRVGIRQGAVDGKLHADTLLLNMHCNCIEVSCKEENGWRAVHSTRSFIQFLSNDFGTVKEIV